MKSSPMVGFYFFVGNEILMEALPLDQGEKSSVSIDHAGGHREYWETLQPKTAAEKKFKARAYDAFPRGRVLFHLKRDRFIIYRDRCINEEQIASSKKSSGSMMLPVTVKVTATINVQNAIRTLWNRRESTSNNSASHL